MKAMKSCVATIPAVFSSAVTHARSRFSNGVSVSNCNAASNCHFSAGATAEPETTKKKSREAEAPVAAKNDSAVKEGVSAAWRDVNNEATEIPRET